MAKGLVNVGGGGGSGGGVKSRIYIPKGADLGYTDNFFITERKTQWILNGGKQQWLEVSKQYARQRLP